MANKYRFKTVSLPNTLHSALTDLAKHNKKSIPGQIAFLYGYYLAKEKGIAKSLVLELLKLGKMEAGA